MICEERVGDPARGKECCVALERARLLGLGLGSDPVLGGSDASSDVAHEEILLGSGLRCKFIGTCEAGALDLRRERMAVSER